MPKLSEKRKQQIDLAVQEYLAGGFPKDICPKYSVGNDVLSRHVKLAGGKVRTRAETAALLHKTNFSFQNENGEWVKKCKQCGNIKPIQKYQPDKTYTDGRSSVCYDCKNEKRRPKSRERYKTDAGYREQCLEFSRKHHKQNPESGRKLHRRLIYQMTPEDFSRRLEEQGGVCAGCGATDPGVKGKDWHVDHDHKCCPQKKTCGKCIRGLLCQPCNLAIGLLKEDPDRMQRLVEYLRKYQNDQDISW